MTLCSTFKVWHYTTINVVFYHLLNVSINHPIPPSPCCAFQVLLAAMARQVLAVPRAMALLGLRVCQATF